MQESLLEHVLKFNNLLHAYRAVKRRILIHGSDEQENDVEHSFNIAMLAWHINSVKGLKLDTEKLFAYALVHDLVEVYAGDTFFYADEKTKAGKEEREALALLRLKDEFPEFPELHATIADYERREDRESKFIYALDKVEPLLSIYQDGGRTWRRDAVSLDMITSMKTAKVAVDPTIERIFKELIEVFKKEHDTLFVEKI
jgi:putative hydrolase of HD superfamily